MCETSDVLQIIAVKSCPVAHNYVTTGLVKFAFRQYTVLGVSRNTYEARRPVLTAVLTPGAAPRARCGGCHMRSPFGRTGCAAEGPAELPGCAGARLPRPRAPSQDHSIREFPPLQRTERQSISA